MRTRLQECLSRVCKRGRAAPAAPRRSARFRRPRVECLEARCLPAISLHEFLGLTANSEPFGITAGPDGNLWFTEALGNRIGRITPAGVVTEFPALPTPNSEPAEITAGPDGNLWFTEALGNRIGRITPAGVVTEFPPLPTANSGPLGITVGPDSNLWFTESLGNRIARITPAGVVTEFPPLANTANSQPAEITAGPDGNLWFTEKFLNRIGRITPAGVVTEFPPLANALSEPFGITAGPDGNLWFTEQAAGFVTPGRIGRITPAGAVTEFPPLPTPNSEPIEITAGPDGNLWFTETEANQIGRISPTGDLTEFGIPTSGGGPAGLTVGPDGNLWFTEEFSSQIGEVILDAHIAASGTPLSTTEGTPFTGTVASFTDPDRFAAAAEYTAVIDWGDGTVSTGLIFQPGGPGTPFQVFGSRSFAEEGTRSVTVTIQDADAALNRTVVTSPLTVGDAPLSAAGTLGTAVLNQVFTATVATFTDANPAAPLSDFAAAIHWGDGTVTAGVVVADGQGGFAVRGSHRYRTIGTFAVMVVITDEGGSAATAFGTWQVGPLNKAQRRHALRRRRAAHREAGLSAQPAEEPAAIVTP
jgi:streptogramin lyase